MRRFVNCIEEHCWVEFCQDWIERRDGLKYPKEANFGSYLGRRGMNDEYYEHISSPGHLMAESISSGELFEIRLLCTNKKGGNYPIVALVDLDTFEEIHLFDCDGNSSDGLLKLHEEKIFFDPGDYVVTNQDAIGIYANNWYMFVSIEKDGTENLKLNGRGSYKRPATEDEILKLNEMLLANNLKWNNETKQLENVQD